MADSIANRDEPLGVFEESFLNLASTVSEDSDDKETESRSHRTRWLKSLLLIRDVIWVSPAKKLSC